ncbi:MAG: hypothetical protein IJ248_01355 [Candidatus Methanomethylophilaceae archaeon]|nr:hypothetical protein [Candidatus Methanomethylophilaceae archaeon]
MGLREFLKKHETDNDEARWEEEHDGDGLNIDLDAAAKAIKVFKNRNKQ